MLIHIKIKPLPFLSIQKVTFLTSFFSILDLISHSYLTTVALLSRPARPAGHVDFRWSDQPSALPKLQQSPRQKPDHVKHSLGHIFTQLPNRIRIGTEMCLCFNICHFGLIWKKQHCCKLQQNTHCLNSVFHLAVWYVTE